jgi:threonine synthase
LPIPLWPDPSDHGLVWKREDLNPTGSFKDRGAETLIEVARDAGAERLVLDSSGSAALAAAAVAARADLPLRLHTPATLGRIRIAALRSFGAEVVAEGTRADAAERAEAESREAFWFSHVYHPAFRAGVAESAREAMAALEGSPPPLWVVPVGNGSLLLGLADALRHAGVAGVRLIAVQTSACPGLRHPGRDRGSRAAGIAIANPPRGGEILEALASTGGEVLEVSEAEIEAGWQELGARGVLAEAASAAVVPAVHALRARGENRRILAWLTGSGHRG